MQIKFALEFLNYLADQQRSVGMKKQKIEETMNWELWASRNDPMHPMKNDKRSKAEDVQMYPHDRYYTVDTIMQLIDHIKSL